MNYPSEESSLIKRLVKENNLQEEQAIIVLQVVSEFAAQKLPVLHGSIHSFVTSEIKLVQKPSAISQNNSYLPIPESL